MPKFFAINPSLKNAEVASWKQNYHEVVLSAVDQVHNQHCHLTITKTEQISATFGGTVSSIASIDPNITVLSPLFFFPPLIPFSFVLLGEVVFF